MRKIMTIASFGRAGVGILLLVLFCLAPLARAASPANFELGNRFYDSGRFEDARAAYQALIQTGNYSANVFYNLGNAQFRLGKKGEAFVDYERALTLDPAHAEAKANLNLLREETGARLPVRSWMERAFTWPDDTTGSHPAWLAAAAFWVLCFSLSPLLFRRRPAWIPASLSVLVLAWCAVAFAFVQARGETWIVKEPQVSARVAPADSSKLAGTLPMGSHVQLLLERGPWIYVVLPGENRDSRGWIPRPAAEPIAICAMNRRKE